MNIFLFWTTTPPNDFQGFLLWGIGGLVGVIVLMWQLYVGQLRKIEIMYQAQIKELKETGDERLKYKDVIISELKTELKETQRSREKMVSEIKPSLDASNSIAANVLEILRDAKK